MTAPPKIRISGLAKAFGTKQVLVGVDLEVMEGESVVIIGGSGSGKSVMLKCILGLIEPDEGRIEIDGTDVTALGGRRREEVNRRIGMLFQGAALFDSLSVWENVAFGLMHGRRTDRAEARRIAIETLTRVGLEADVATLQPSELSGGMKKRVALARAIATRPEMIFFDEPTTGLDPIMGDVINRLIASTVRELGATTLTITHDMASARHIAHRMAMLHDGRIIWSGPVAEAETTDNPHVRQFISGSAEGPIQMTARG